MHHDPLTPPISEFVISEEEQKAIDYALTLKDSWKLEQDSMDDVRDTLKSLRDRIKDFHLKRQKNTCCYCRTNLHGGGMFMVDREHIVPKSYCKSLTYVITNLSVACKRCNMEIKKNKTHLFVDIDSIEQSHLDLNSYRIIHPNFEVYEEFILRTHTQVGTGQLIKFIKAKESEKTDYMFDFFKLRDLEINSFDVGQGLPPVSQDKNLLLDALECELRNQPQLTLKILHLLTHEHSGERVESKPIAATEITLPSRDELFLALEKDYPDLRLESDQTETLKKFLTLRGSLPIMHNPGGGEQ